MTLPGPQEGTNPEHVEGGPTDDEALAPATPTAEGLGDAGVDHDDIVDDSDK